LVDNIINYAAWDACRALSSDIAVNDVFQIADEASVLEWAFRFERSFLINGRVDTIISSSRPLPLPTQDTTTFVSSARLQSFQRYQNDLLYRIGKGSWPLLLKDKSGKFHSSLTVSHPPTPLSSFLHYRDNNKALPAPFLNVLIDEKSLTAPLNRSQMILFLYSSLASQARYCNIQSPSSAIGIVTDARRWNFLVFQLNTLNLQDQKQKNVVWEAEKELYELDVPSKGITFKREPYDYLKNITSLVAKGELVADILPKQ